MPDDVILRRPRPDEIDALAELHAWSWRVTYGPLMSEEERKMLTVGERRRFWQRALHEPRPREAQWVAELDGRLVGMVHSSPSRDGDALPGTGEIAAIHVKPGLHGQGIGGRVLAAALDDLRSAGFHRATLWTLRENHEARRFYEAKGWRVDSATKHVSMGDFDGLPIVDEVRYEREL